jgi:hypothetical protein
MKLVGLFINVWSDHTSLIMHDISDLYLEFECYNINALR